MKKTFLTSLVLSSYLFSGTIIHNNMDDRISGYSYDGDKKDYEANSDGLGVVAFQHYSGVKSINNELKTQKVLRNVLTFSLNPSLPGFDLGKLENIKIGIENGIIGSIEDKDILDQLNDGNESNNNTENTIGAPCDDSNNTTVNTVWQSDGITCSGGNIVGTTCDDGDSLTNNDVWLSNGLCSGEIPSYTVGASCDDNNPNTVNETWSSNGICENGYIVGSSCDDGDNNTINDVWLSSGYCQGEISVGLGDGYLHTNGVTIKCENGTPGSTFDLNNKTYYIAVDRNDLESKINANSNLSLICTSHVTDMNYLFHNRQTTNPDISSWDTSNVIDMKGMFGLAGKFNSNIGYWDTGKVTNMSNMFYYANSFSHDISNWNVSNVTNMINMFYGIKYLYYDLNKWDVSSVTLMNNMFQMSNYNYDISQWDVSNVVDMTNMFHSSAFSKPLNKWDVSNVEKMDGMFYGKHYSQPLNNWYPTKITVEPSTFYYNGSETPKWGQIKPNGNLLNTPGVLCDDSNSNTINTVWQDDGITCGGGSIINNNYGHLATEDDSTFITSRLNSYFPILNTYDVIILGSIDASQRLPFSLKFKDSSGNNIPLVNEDTNQLLYNSYTYYGYYDNPGQPYDLAKALDFDYSFSPESDNSYTFVTSNTAKAFNLPPNISPSSLEVLSNLLKEKPTSGKIFMRIKGTDYSFDFSTLPSGWSYNPIEQPTFSTDLN